MRGGSRIQVLPGPKHSASHAGGMDLCSLHPLNYGLWVSPNAAHVLFPRFKAQLQRAGGGGFASSPKQRVGVFPALAEPKAPASFILHTSDAPNCPGWKNPALPARS